MADPPSQELPLAVHFWLPLPSAPTHRPPRRRGRWSAHSQATSALGKDCESSSYCPGRWRSSAIRYGCIPQRSIFARPIDNWPTARADAALPRRHTRRPRTTWVVRLPGPPPARPPRAGDAAERRRRRRTRGRTALRRIRALTVRLGVATTAQLPPLPETARPHPAAVLRQDQEQLQIRQLAG